jgi:hypothetical protein
LVEHVAPQLDLEVLADREDLADLEVHRPEEEVGLVPEEDLLEVEAHHPT